MIFELSGENRNFITVHQIGGKNYDLEWYDDAPQILSYLNFHAEGERKTWDEPAPEDEEWRELYKSFVRSNGDIREEKFDCMGLRGEEHINLHLIDYIDELED